MGISTDNKQVMAATSFLTSLVVLMSVLVLSSCAAFQMEAARDYPDEAFEAAVRCGVTRAQLDAAMGIYEHGEFFDDDTQELVDLGPGSPTFRIAADAAREAGADDRAADAAAQAAYTRWLVDRADLLEEHARLFGDNRDAALAAEAASRDAVTAAATAAAAAHRAYGDYQAAANSRAQAALITAGADPDVAKAIAPDPNRTATGPLSVQPIPKPAAVREAAAAATSAGLDADVAHAAAVAAARLAAGSTTDPQVTIDQMTSARTTLANAEQAAYENALRGEDATDALARAAARGVMQEIRRLADPALAHLRLNASHVRAAGYNEAYKVIDDVDDELQLTAASTAARRAQIAAVNTLGDAGIDLRTGTGMEDLSAAIEVWSVVALEAVTASADRDDASAAAPAIAEAAFNGFLQERDRATATALDELREAAKRTAASSPEVVAAQACTESLDRGGDCYGPAYSAALHAGASIFDAGSIGRRLEEEVGHDPQRAHIHALQLAAEAEEQALARVDERDARQYGDIVARVQTLELASVPENADEAYLDGNLAAQAAQAINTAATSTQRASDAWRNPLREPRIPVERQAEHTRYYAPAEHFRRLARAYITRYPSGCPGLIATPACETGEFGRRELQNNGGLVGLAQARADKIAGGYNVPLIGGSPLASDDRPQLREQAWIVAQYTQKIKDQAYRFLESASRASAAASVQAANQASQANEAAAEAESKGGETVTALQASCPESQERGTELLQVVPISGTNPFDPRNPAGGDGTGLGPSGNPILTVIWEGGGEGVVTSNPPGMSCSHVSGTTCQLTFSAGQSVNLIPIPAGGSFFSHWGVGECDDDSGATGCIVIMNSDRTINVFIE